MKRGYQIMSTCCNAIDEYQTKTENEQYICAECGEWFTYVTVAQAVVEAMIQEQNDPITDQGSNVENIFAEMDRAGDLMEKKLGKKRFHDLLDRTKEK